MTCDLHTVLKKFSHGKGWIEVLGGKLIVFPILFIHVASILLIVVGSIGAAATYNPNDETLSLMFFQACCVGFPLFCCVICFGTMYILRSVARIVRQTFENDNRACENPQLQVELEEMLKRFWFVNYLGSIPFFSLLFVMHAFVLPLFWWVIMFHLLNAVCALFVCWYSVTPTKQRIRIYNRFLPSRMQIDEQSRGSKFTSKNSDGSKKQVKVESL